MTISSVGSDRPLNVPAVAAVVLGNMLEFYDFITYTFFAKYIGDAFFPSGDPTASLLASLAVFWAGFFMRPIGGIFIGAFADRAGRKPAMVLTIGLMALGMLMLAATPGHRTIGWWAPAIVILGRLIQGFALGGEVGPSTAYLLEAAPPAQRAIFASWQIASQGLATLAAGAIGLILSLSLPLNALSEWGWRVPFILGILIVPVGMVIRSHLPETAGHGADPTAAATTGEVLRRLFHDHLGRLVLTLFVIMAATVSFYIGANMPTYAESALQLPPHVASLVTMALGVASIVFTLFGGWLADRIGRRPVMIVPRALIVLVAIPAFALVVHHPSPGAIYAVTILLSALSSISTAAIIVGVPEALPRDVRSAGLSIVYAVSVSLFGGSAPWLVTKLIQLTGDKVAPAYYLAATSLIGAVAAYLMPETRGREL